MSRLVTSCHIMSSCSRILLPNLSSEPSKFFYYSGGGGPDEVFETVALCGIRLGATLSLWRRAHCERVRGPHAHFCDLAIVLRGRLRGSGVLRAYRGHAAALCRGDWVRGVFCTRMVNVRFACRLRGSCVLGACWRAVSAALCRGDWVRGVSRARMILHAVFRVAGVGLRMH